MSRYQEGSFFPIVAPTFIDLYSYQKTAVLIIIKNIPHDLPKKAIENLITPLLISGFLQKNGTLDSLRIIEATNSENSFSECHCVLAISPEFVAKRIIKKLNGKRHFGVSLAVQEYVIRNWRNSQQMDVGKIKKTIGRMTNAIDKERRRKDLIIRPHLDHH